MLIAEIRRRLLVDIERLKSPSGYLNTGYPRYNTLFGRDSIISAWQMLKIDPLIARSTLWVLAKHQGKAVNLKAEEEPGKILHEHRFNIKEQAELPEWDFPYYGSVDSTPLFIILAWKYYIRTGDKRFLSKIWTNIIAASNWIRKYGDKDEDGYLEYSRLNPNGLFHQGWMDGIQDHLETKPPVAIVEAQGYTYSAYRSLVLLANKLGNNEASRQALAESTFLKKKFNNDFWMEKEKCFAFALDGEKRQKKVVTSNQGHLLFTGIVEENKISNLIARLFQPDLLTPYGIRTRSTEAPDFDPYSYHKGSIWPHDNWVIYKGLQNLGFNRYANQIRSALLRAYFKLGKIPELYSVVDNKIVDLTLTTIIGTIANPLQAWASAGLLEMIWDD